MMSPLRDDTWDEPWDEREGDLKPVALAVADVLQHGWLAGPSDRDPELARLPYPEYLRTQHWQSKRTRALQRAGYRCQRCSASRRRLDVHHLTYVRLGRELEADLRVLCGPCHANEHKPPEAL